MRRLGTWLVLLSVLAAAPALGQERYTLDGSDWTQQAAPDPATPEGQLFSARKLLAEGQAKRAEQAVTAWLKRYPNHPARVEALLLRGDARVARNELYKALFDYEDLLRDYPASEQFKTALEREFQIARLFSGGWKRKLFGTFRILTNYGEAVELYIRIQERAPGTAVGEDASLALGDHYFDRGEMRDAAEAYDLFLLNYPRSARREWAMLRQIQANLATFRGPQFNATGLLDAQENLRQYRDEFPVAAEKIGVDALLVRIQESLALKALSSAKWYEQVDRDLSAAYLYRRVIREYPQTAAAELAVARLDAMGAPLNEGDVEGGPPLEGVGFGEGGGAGATPVGADELDDAGPLEVAP